MKLCFLFQWSLILSFFMKGLYSTLKEFNFSPGLFMNSFHKRHHVCLSSFEPNRLVFGKSERGNQLCLFPNQCLKFQMRRLGKFLLLQPLKINSGLFSDNIMIEQIIILVPKCVKLCYYSLGIY
jgi:hypothetical protein